MANGINPTTRQFSTPYLTIDEYKQAPSSIDYTNLVVNSTDPNVQDAELSNVIARASSWIDQYCNQVLGATTNTETQRSRMRSDGTIRIHPRYSPIVALTAFNYGVSPNQMVSFPDCSQAWIEDESLIIPYSTANLTYSSQGPLQFGLPAIPRAEIYCEYTYVNGYTSSLLASNASVGASSITVTDGTGITAGSELTIYDGLATENIVVDSSYAFGSTTVPLDSPLVFGHSSGVAVSALPPAVKQAAILATTAFLKVRGDGSMTMMSGSAVNYSSYDKPTHDNDLEIAKELLLPFRRIR